MNLQLTEDQKLLADSAERFLMREYDFQARRRAGPRHASCWPLFAEMGWLGQPIAECWGGFGGTALSTGLLQFAFGRHLVAEPFHACVVLAARLLECIGSDEQRQGWLRAIAGGRTRIALAHDDLASVDPWQAPALTALPRGDRWTLQGHKTLAIGVPGADAILVTASVQDRGVRVFLVRPSLGGLGLRTYATIDGFEAADLEFVDAVVGADTLVGGDVDVQPALAHVLAEGLVSACWDACGAMTAAYEQTVGYTRQRVQFGKPLAEFQVVQHRLAEMAVSCAEARAACELASLRLERGDGDAVTLAAMAKSKVGRCADSVVKDAVQLHGAIGTTEELPVSAWFRRIAAFNLRGGAPETHAQLLGRRRLAASGWRESQTLPTAGATI